jgi:hypothetical protein
VERRLILALFALTASSGHTFHSSLAQIDYISAKKTLEVIVWIHGEDLERLMRKKLGKNATLDKQKEAERFVHGYLREYFEIKTAAGKPLAQNWVGLEVRTHFVTAYFECSAPEGLTGLTLTNRVLLDALPDQVNAVKVKQDGKDRLELTFDNSGGAGPQPLAGLQTR